MKKTTFLLLLFFIGQLAMAQTIVEAHLIASKSISQINAVIGSSGGPYNTVKIYKVSYNTTDVHNNPTVATGAIFVPGLVCDSLPLLGYCHGTVLRKSQVPSAQYDSNYEGLFFSAKGYVVAMPDYLGLGDNAGYHPYVHGESEATATIDLMRALREFINDSTSLGLNGQVFITGYSQGGHAAMATLKYIEEHNLLSEFDVVAGGPMSGPYSISTVQPHSFYDSTYSYNAFTPYVVNSYQYVYGNLYTDISDFYDAPYDTIIPPLLDGTHTFEELNFALPVNVYDFMNDSILDEFIADSINFTTPLRHDLKLNDNHSWHATMPMRLCYCGSDTLVLAQNSVVAADSMTAMGSTDVQAINLNPAGDHFTCFTPAITYVRNYFDSLKVLCSATSGVQELAAKANIVFAFPNPTSGIININSGTNLKEVQLIDVNGKVILKQENINETSVQLNTVDISNGFYIIKSVDQRGGTMFNKIMVQKGS